MLIMAMSIQNQMWCLLGIVIAGGSIFALVRYSNKSRNKDPNRQIPQRLSINSGVIFAEPDSSEITEEIKSIIKFFSGFMNSLLDISKGVDADDANITFENLKQVVEGHGSPRLKEWFWGIDKDRIAWDTGVYKDKALQVLQALKKCGIKPSVERRTEWNAETERHYKKIGRIEQGQIVEVVAPCWIYEHEVFEKGLVKSIN